MESNTVKNFMFNTAKRLTHVENALIALGPLMTQMSSRLDQLEENVMNLQKLTILMDRRIDRLNHRRQ